MSTHSPNPIKILLFEDDAFATDLILKNLDLAPQNFEITTARSLKEGLPLIGEGSFDVILLDLSLHENFGIETLKAVLDQAGHEALIVLAEAEDEHLPIKALQVGAQDYLFKDRLTSEALGRSIRYAIERANLVRRLQGHSTEAQNREALLRAIFDANTDPMLILGTDYRIKFFNQAAASLLDISENSLVGETFPFEVNTTEPTEFEIPETSGGSRLVELSASDLTWEGEHALLVLLRDITRRRIAELGLRREKERLSVTLDSIADAVIATNASGAVERINEEASRLMGMNPEEVIGQPLGEVLALRDPKTGKRIGKLTERMMESDFAEAFSKTGLLLGQEGEASPFLVTAEIRQILDEDELNHGCVTVLRDITKKKKAEDELFKTEKLNSISLLAGGIAHDFNNMLTAILGNISVVRMGIDPKDPNADKLLAAETAAIQAKSLTQQLLAFSKGGAPVLKVTTIDEFVEESARFVLRGSNVKCEVEKEAKLWAIDADKGQISQVVNNLIINADQAMPDGGTIHIRLKNQTVRQGEIPTLNPGDYVCIEVADEGSGIEPEDLTRIFDPYFTTKAEGNGLGLASSYSIINSHKGVMTVDSTVGKGSTFRVFLPRSSATQVAPEPQETPPKEEQSEEIHKGRGRILVMDDMEAMMMVAGEILNVLGYEVEFSTNGEEAIEAYKKAKESGNPFDAVVFDLTVPGGMGGEEASEILIRYDPDLIAIASSGYTTSNIMSNHKNSAFKAVVPKPYRIKEMSDALHRVLSESHSH
jgi:PAS domain S-box-containing protein